MRKVRENSPTLTLTPLPQGDEDTKDLNLTILSLAVLVRNLLLQYSNIVLRYWAIVLKYWAIVPLTPGQHSPPISL